MNNAQLSIEEEPEPRDSAPELRTREGELVELIETLRRVLGTEDWRTLKTKIFDGELGKLEKRITSEAGKSEVTVSNLYRLQGQIAAAKKYDLDALATALRQELTIIRLKLHGK